MDSVDGDLRELALRFVRESGSVVYARVGPDGRLVEWNGALPARLGVDDDALADLRFDELLTADDAESLRRIANEGEGLTTRLVNFVDAAQSPFTLRCHLLRSGSALLLLGEDVPGDREGLEDHLMEMSRELSVLNRERARQSRELAETKAELERTLEDLETSYWHLKKVQEVIPLCMHCGRIRGDDGASWENVAQYFRSNEIFVSHGLCPTCAREHYGEELAENGKGEE